MSNSISNTLPESVEINGIRWATRNVDVPGTFVSNPEDFGQYYQSGTGKILMTTVIME